MKYLRKYIKAVSAFLLINFLYATFSPAISYALTAGPTSPEATSFEPVDTTDMVNPMSGDLAYNIPLLEVPGPSGGYPLSLSYHAGIMPGEEASWVGLGWTLNPGAINRTVSGFPDDFKGVENTNRFYWKGGERHEGQIGVTYGVSNMVGATAGLSVGYDTYQGFGVGMFLAAGVGIYTSGMIQAGVGARVGVDPWGNPSASVGLNVGIGSGEAGAVSAGVSVGISTNFKTVSAYAGAGVGIDYGNSKSSLSRGSASVAGVSISSQDRGSANVSIGGASLVGNSKSGNMSTSSYGIFLPLPFVHLAYSYQRYWIDEIDATNVNGVFHYPEEGHFDAEGDSWHYYDNNAYDTYSLLDPKLDGGLVDGADPDKAIGGTLPNYDHYSVAAQGVNGSFRPHIYHGFLSQQNKVYDDHKHEKINFYLGENNTEDIEFRFTGGFTNRYVHNPTALNYDADNSFLLEYEENTGSIEVGEPVDRPGFQEGASGNDLADSRKIDFLTNRDIIDKTSKATDLGFIENKSTGFSRSMEGHDGDKIGAYIITNATGVKYHFTLPVYTRNEYQMSRNIDDDDSFSEIKKPESYAYTWLLTAVTGPDYVDRGTDGEFDESDYGYWVEFDYGKWTDQYMWRSPDEGTHKDIDTNFENFSSGIKEIYYLDAIRTKTHTAFFVKEKRADAKSSLQLFRSIDERGGGNYLSDDTNDNLRRGKSTSQIINGGFKPLDYSCQCKVVINNAIKDDGEEDGYDDGYNIYDYNYIAKPVSSLKLNKIMLFNHYVDFNKNAGEEYTENIVVNTTKEMNELGVGYCPEYSEPIETQFPNNILDVHDEVVNLEPQALRIIRFNSTNDTAEGALQAETANSYDNIYVENIVGNFPLLGKLTLKSLNFNGKGGASLIPPMQFRYELTNDELAAGASSKNPPYSSDKYDVWGMYKSDFSENENANVKHATTKTSALNNDVWSLRGIQSSMGTNIELSYESDNYNKSAMNFTSLTIKDIEVHNEESDLLKVSFDTDIEFNNSSHFDIGTPLDIIGAIRYYGTGNKYFTSTACGVGTDQFSHVFGWDVFDCSAVIGQVFSDYLIIESSSLMEQVLYEYGDNRWFNYETGEIGSEQPSGWWDFPDPGIFVGGEMIIDAPLHDYGGGIRVKAVKTSSLTHNQETRYEYNNGTTSYEPNFLTVPIIGFADHISPCTEIWEEYIFDEYKKLSLQKNGPAIEELLSNARLLPTPGVLYEHVKKEEYIIDEDGVETKLPGSVAYHFQTFDKGMVGIDKPDYDANADIAINNGEETINKDFMGLQLRRLNLGLRKIKDFSSQVGQLISFSTYDVHDNLVSQTKNKYLYDLIESESGARVIGEEGFVHNIENYEPLFDQYFDNQGVIKETYVAARSIKDLDGDIDGDKDKGTLLGIVTTSEYFPSVLVGSTTTNYKTGITTETKNLAFDFYSGQVTKTLSSDGQGNSYVSKVTPAYRVKKADGTQAYPGMGLALNGGKNMISQTAASQTYKVNPNDVDEKLAIVSASVQTWNNQWNYRESDGTWEYGLATEDEHPVWRKHKSYSYIGEGDNIEIDAGIELDDGLLDYTSDPVFTSWTGEDVADEWQKNNEIMLFDRYSHALEAQDVNGNFAATKMDSKQEKVLTTAANANYDEFAYSGAEDELDGNYFGGAVSAGSGERASGLAHSGSYSLKVGANSNGFAYDVLVDNKNETKNYIVSVWVHSTNVNQVKLEWDLQKVGFGPPSVPQELAFDIKESKKVGDWYQVNALIPVALDATDEDDQYRLKLAIRNDGAGFTYFDDFRVVPLDAVMTSYVYNDMDELTHVIDNNGLYTRYEYDAMGRLVATHRESFKYGEKKVSENTVHYSQEPTSNK